MALSPRRISIFKKKTRAVGTKRALVHGLSVLTSLICLVALWQILSYAVGSALILPDIRQVFGAARELLQKSAVKRALIETFLRCIWAFCISFCVGSTVGFLSHSVTFVKYFFALPLWVIKATPVVAIVLLTMFYMPSSHIPVFVASLIAIPLIAGATEKGLAGADVKLQEALQMYGVGQLRRFWYVDVYSLLPFLKQGARSAYGLIWKAVAAGEVLSLPKNALGSLLQRFQVHLETASVFAITAIIVLCGFLSEALFTLFASGISALLKKAPFLHTVQNTRIVPAIHSKECAFEPRPIRAEHLCASYRNIQHGETVILNDFNFFAEASSCTALLAPSGTGKTTLLTALARHIKAHGGSVSYLYQEPRLVPQLTLFENVLLPLKAVFPKKRAQERAVWFLEKSGLLPLAHRLPEQVSGGERQRAALARAFAFPSEVLLMDEAFQAQDVVHEMHLIEEFCAMQEKEARTVVFSSHNVREAVILADSILILGARPLFVKETIRCGTHQSAPLYGSPDEAVLNAEKRVYESLLS